MALNHNYMLMNLNLFLNLSPRVDSQCPGVVGGQHVVEFFSFLDAGDMGDRKYASEHTYT